jgi:hypothetical protein
MKRLKRALVIISASTVMTMISCSSGSKNLHKDIKGKWISISCELRPREVRGKGGVPESFWLTREFTFDGADNFTGLIKSYADPECKVPVTDFYFAGHLEWKGPHAVASGAEKVDYVLDREFSITPRATQFADQLNQLPPGACGAEKWVAGKTQSLLKQPCVLFNIKAGELVKDFDLVYLFGYNNLLFMGAKHVNGQGFYEEKLRPVGGLQVPLVRD